MKPSSSVATQKQKTIAHTHPRSTHTGRTPTPQEVSICAPRQPLPHEIWQHGKEQRGTPIPPAETAPSHAADPLRNTTGIRPLPRIPAPNNRNQRPVPERVRRDIKAQAPTCRYKTFWRQRILSKKIGFYASRF